MKRYRFKKLAKLNSADDIATFLRSKGIRGVKGSMSRCPISRYIRGRSREPVSVRTDSIYFGKSVLTPTPAMKQFIERFDRCLIDIYPELVEEWDHS